RADAAGARSPRGDAVLLESAAAGSSPPAARDRLQERAGRLRTAADAVRQRSRITRERPPPDLRLQRGRHGPRGPAARAAARRAATHTRRGAGADGALSSAARASHLETARS